MPAAVPAILLSLSAVVCLWWAWRRPLIDWRLRGLAAMLAAAALLAFMLGYGADRGAAIGVLVLVCCGLTALAVQSLARPARGSAAPRPPRMRDRAVQGRGARLRPLAGAVLIGLGSGLAALYLSALTHLGLQHAGVDAAANLVLAMCLFPLAWTLLAVALAWLPGLRPRSVLLLACLLPAALILHA